MVAREPLGPTRGSWLRAAALGFALVAGPSHLALFYSTPACPDLSWSTGSDSTPGGLWLLSEDHVERLAREWADSGQSWGASAESDAAQGGSGPALPQPRTPSHWDLLDEYGGFGAPEGSASGTGRPAPASDPVPQIAIHVFAHRRPRALRRLLESLNASDYLTHTHIPLTMHVDGGYHPEVLRLVDAFVWPYGAKKVLVETAPRGLRDMMVAGWDGKFTGPLSGHHGEPDRQDDHAADHGPPDADKIVHDHSAVAGASRRSQAVVGERLNGGVFLNGPGDGDGHMVLKENDGSVGPDMDVDGDIAEHEADETSKSSGADKIAGENAHPLVDDESEQSSQEAYGVFFEDDVSVSPLWYLYTLYCIKHHLEGPFPGRDLAGCSLYTPRLDELSPTPDPQHPPAFIPENVIGADVHLFYWQVPCSWGMAWKGSVWKRFKRFFATRVAIEDATGGLTSGLGPLATIRSNQWHASWKRFMIEFMVLESLVALYPSYPNQQSFSTNHYEEGVHTVAEALDSAVDSEPVSLPMDTLRPPELIDARFTVPLLGSDDFWALEVLPLISIRPESVASIPWLNVFAALSSREALRKAGAESLARLSLTHKGLFALLTDSAVV